jgi:hypothetical protein
VNNAELIFYNALNDELYITNAADDFLSWEGFVANLCKMLGKPSPIIYVGEL